ncbi:MAG TPA: hypothetical protein OIM35_08465 [Clostridiaceae bacterium]|nr:hypothetical protein [Clostridiaceae bacterium]
MSSEKTLIRCRDKLIENKLFEYEKGTKSKPNKYKISTVNFTVNNKTTVNNTADTTVNMTVDVGVDVSNINRLDKDIYINLLNKYARKNRNDFSEYVKVVSKMKDDPDWEKMSWEEQQKIISEI